MFCSDLCRGGLQDFQIEGAQKKKCVLTRRTSRARSARSLTWMGSRARLRKEMEALGHVGILMLSHAIWLKPYFEAFWYKTGLWKNKVDQNLEVTRACCAPVWIRHWLIVSWEPEGRYCNSKMFRWDPEGRYCCTKSMAIAPFWFSEHLWSALAHSGKKLTLCNQYQAFQKSYSTTLFNMHSCKSPFK